MTVDSLLSQILSTAPFQLPPISKANGVYSLDFKYKGESIYAVKSNFEEILQDYLDFIFIQNRIGEKDLIKIISHPTRPGAFIYSKRRVWNIDQ